MEGVDPVAVNRIVPPDEIVAGDNTEPYFIDHIFTWWSVEDTGYRIGDPVFSIPSCKDLHLVTGTGLQSFQLPMAGIILFWINLCRLYRY